MSRLRPARPAPEGAPGALLRGFGARSADGSASSVPLVRRAGHTIARLFDGAPYGLTGTHPLMSRLRPARPAPEGAPGALLRGFGARSADGMRQRPSNPAPGHLPLRQPSQSAPIGGRRRPSATITAVREMGHVAEGLPTPLTVRTRPQRLPVRTTHGAPDTGGDIARRPAAAPAAPPLQAPRGADVATAAAGLMVPASGRYRRRMDGVSESRADGRAPAPPAAGAAIRPSDLQTMVETLVKRDLSQWTASRLAPAHLGQRTSEALARQLVRERERRGR